MESSGGNYHPPGTQDEPFFDLLQQSSAPTSVPKTGYSNSASASAAAYNNAPKRMENTADFNLGGDDVLPSFDFQPIRTTPASASSTASGGSASATAVRIEEGRQGSPPSSYTSYEPMVRRSREPPPTYETPVTRPLEHEKESFDSATAAAVERTMKKYADNLLRVLEGMTGRLSQLESSTQRLEHLFEEIKNVIGDTHGEADGKFRSLESHILEVQRGVQVLRDRQEIFEAQSQLAKLQLTAKGEAASLHSAPSAPPPPPTPPSVSESPSQLVRASSGKALMEAPQRQVAETPSSYYQPQPQLQLQQMPSLPAPPPQQPHPPPQQPIQQQPPPQQQHALQQQQQVQPQQQLQQQPMQLHQPGVLQNEVSHQLQQQQPMQLQQPGVLQNEVSHQTLHQQQPPPPPLPQQQLSHPPQHQPQPQPPHLPPTYPQQPQQQQQQQSPYNQQQQPSSQPPPIPNYGPPADHPSYGQHPQGPHPGSHHVPLPPSSYPSDLPSYHPSYGPPRPGLPPPPPPPSQQPQQPHNVGMYEPSMGRSGSGQSTQPAPPYLPQGHPPHYEAQGMNPGSGYPGSSYRVAQPVPSAPSGSGGSGGYPRLPVAQPLPHAMPAGGGGPGIPSGNPSLSTNRVPIDEVIDKVTAMGFSKDQVRAVVRRLTENGQSVDLNIVLDKLMNGDSSQAPPKGWFGR